MTDFNSGVFTGRLDPFKTITIGHHDAQVNGKAYASVEMDELLAELARRSPECDWNTPKTTPSAEPIVGGGEDPISAEALYPQWANFLKPGDILLAESGTASIGLVSAFMPQGATFHNQTLWGSIGWATLAAFGAAVAAPDKRVVLVTGDGAHQLTAQEISQFGRRGLKPIVFLLNNDGYLIERMFCKNPAIAYDDLAPWRYAELPRVFGCADWLTARATTCGELDAALDNATNSNTGFYIEVVTDANAAPALMVTMSDVVKAFYNQK
jgi:indolepyruvate decarboxylase